MSPRRYDYNAKPVLLRIGIYPFLLHASRKGGIHCGHMRNPLRSAYSHTRGIYRCHVQLQYMHSRNFSRFRVYVEPDACKRLLICPGLRPAQSPPCIVSLCWRLALRLARRGLPENGPCLRLSVFRHRSVVCLTVRGKGRYNY